MSDDYKSRIIKAINKFETKHTLVNDKPKRHNEKPEKEVERDVLLWLRKIDCFINVYDSAAQPDSYNNFKRVHVKTGTPDLIGCTAEGVFIAIELKAPGRRSTLKEHQRYFLNRVIKNNGFAACIDSVDRLRDLYNAWIRLEDPEMKENLLLLDLPDLPKKDQDTRPLFSDDDKY